MCVQGREKAWNKTIGDFIFSFFLDSNEQKYKKGGKRATKENAGYTAVRLPTTHPHNLHQQAIESDSQHKEREEEDEEKREGNHVLLGIYFFLSD